MRSPGAFVLFLALATIAHADFVPIGFIGTQNGDPLEFGDNTWSTSAPPGSATTLDDDYYFAGVYPLPIGTVPSTEPWSNFENAVNSGNNTPISRIHFSLSAAEATATARLRVVAHLVWGGWWNNVTNQSGAGYGTHTLELRLNGSVIGTHTADSRSTVVVEVDASSSAINVGPNVLQITRTGGSPSGWVHFDALSLEIDATALTDADADGLPRWWEEDHDLNDAVASDAAADSDADGLTNAAEFSRRTDPRHADTDGDGLKDGVETDTGSFVSLMDTGTDPLEADTDGDTLSDGEETALSPRPNPLQTDSDGDGAADAWEVQVGYDPTTAASTPPAFAGALGINFVSEVNPQNRLTPLAVTGLVPQQNWNNSLPLTSWGSPAGGLAEIATPLLGLLTDSAGMPRLTTVAWTSPSHVWANGNGGDSPRKLLDGYLIVNSDAPVTVTFAQVPFATYDVIAYVGGVYDGAVGCLRLNGLEAHDRWFITSSTPPQKDFVQPLVSDQTKPWRGNAIRYRNVTGNAVTLTLHRTGGHEVGLHGVQIIDAAADQDGDGLPDAWEFAHKLRPDIHDAAADPDGDGLGNSGEYARATDPRNVDSDGDGLTDLVETATGLWVNAGNSGTNPLVADTDADGLTDGAEVATLPSPTNPNLADTDGDGRTDAEEALHRSNPLVVEGAFAFLPVVTTAPRTFDWTVSNVQMVWNHPRGHLSEREWGSDDLLLLSVANSVAPGTDALVMGLPLRDGSITYFLYSNHAAAFSHPGDDGWDIWESDWNNPPLNLRAGLGFSGYGFDISDRLRFRIQGSSPGAQGNWTLTFTVYNQDTGVTLLTRTMSGCHLADSVHQGAVQWEDGRTTSSPNRIHVSAHPGVQVYLQSTPLESTPAFAAHKDTDEDGMPDIWEDANGLNKNLAADASLDPDLDGLSNVLEFVAGTSPAASDTDGDLAADGLEVQSGSNPLLATSLPPRYRGLPGVASGEDFNGNGMPDAWELWSGTFTLDPLADPDGDGQPNGQEAIAGTNPLSAGSRLWSNVRREGSDLVMSWPLLHHKQHRVWQSTDLATWSLAAGTPEMVGSEFKHAMPGALSGAGPLFLRAGVRDLDSDGDGVSDWTETQVTGSNPAAANSTGSALAVDDDQDGVPESSLSGDYASLLDRFEGARAQGGFAGAAGGSTISRGHAARFLMQAAFGPTSEDIERVQTLGYAGWITEQASLPPTLHSTYIRQIYGDMLSQRSGGGYNVGGGDADPFLFGNNMMTTFARATIQGKDQLRQRVAFALSQILVTSRRDANLENRCLGMADYYDIFVRNAFGNYSDVLQEVTMHPVMGRYLSHVGNQKARPEINQYPDENFAREVMQLFTVGLWELHPDGSRQVDDQGQPIPAYSNTEITQLARVFTGLWFGGHNWGGGGWTEADYATPMSMHADRHDFGQKTLLQAFAIPARAATQENALRDIRDAIRHLFEHPNTGVFVGRQLIQFLVTDNPSPAYIARIASVFADNGAGVRGDLAAVVRAILLDEEARDLRFAESPSHGRLKEPVIRAMALGRAFGLQQVPDLLWWDWNDFYNASRQEPTFSPSVFNYYRPEYRAPGLLTQNNLAGPVFQITDSFSSISFPNRLWQMLEEGFSQWEGYQFPLDLSREKQLAATPERLVDHVNTLFCGGRMRPSTRSLVLAALNQIPAHDATARARVAAYLAMVCPEGAILK